MLDFNRLVLEELLLESATDDILKFLVDTHFTIKGKPVDEATYRNILSKIAKAPKTIPGDYLTPKGWSDQGLSPDELPILDAICEAYGGMSTWFKTNKGFATGTIDELCTSISNMLMSPSFNPDWYKLLDRKDSTTYKFKYPEVEQLKKTLSSGSWTSVIAGINQITNAISPIANKMYSQI